MGPIPLKSIYITKYYLMLILERLHKLLINNELKLKANSQASIPTHPFQLISIYSHNIYYVKLCRESKACYKHPGRATKVLHFLQVTPFLFN